MEEDTKEKDSELVEETKKEEKEDEKVEKKEQIDLSGDVRYEGSAVLRYETTSQDKPIKIDREKNMLYGVRGMLAEKVRKDYYYDYEGQKRLHKQYEGFSTGVNHDYKNGAPTVERTIGKIQNSYMDEKGMLFDIQMNPKHERTEQIYADAETGLNTISISTVNSRCEQRGDKVVDWVPAGADFVVNAGQTTKLFEQEDTKYESLKKEIELLKGKFTKFEQVQPAVVNAAVNKSEQKFAQRGVDLKEFRDRLIYK